MWSSRRAQRSRRCLRSESRRQLYTSVLLMHYTVVQTTMSKAPDQLNGGGTGRLALQALCFATQLGTNPLLDPLRAIAVARVY